MKRVLLWLAAMVLFSLATLARDIQTLDGKVYKNVVVTRVEITGIKITYDDGIGFIDFALLPLALKKEFGYSQEAYAAVVAAWQQTNAAAIEAKREADLVLVAQQQEKEKQQAQAQATAVAVPATAPALQPDAGGAGYSSVSTYATRSYSTNSYASRDYSASSSTYVSPSEKTEHVRGYYRKDGTYVHPYNRRPRSH